MSRTDFLIRALTNKPVSVIANGGEILQELKRQGSYTYDGNGFEFIYDYSGVVGIIKIAEYICTDFRARV